LTKLTLNVMNAQLIINVHEAKTHFSKLLERAHGGQEVILAKAGKPYARLMPLAPVVSKRQPGRLSGLGEIGSAFFEPLPDAELAAWSPNEAQRDTSSRVMK
jgi:prevent-host-death family protein